LNYDFINNKELNDIKKIPDLKIIEEELSDIESDDLEDNKNLIKSSQQKENFNKEENINNMEIGNKDNIIYDKIHIKIDYKFKYFEKKY